MAVINTCMTEDQIQIRKASIEWMNQNKSLFTHAVTLTLKPYRVIQSERGRTVQKLSHIEAKQTLRFFLKRLNIALFRKAARFGKSVHVVPVLEGQVTNKLLHYHCAVGNIPQDMDASILKLLICDAWAKTPFGNKQADIQLINSTAWFAYMGKEIGINDADVVDWENVRISV